jgi:DNA-nicking Smr family endonuclease
VIGARSAPLSADEDLWKLATEGAERLADSRGQAPPAPPREAQIANQDPELLAYEELRALVAGEGTFDLADTDEYIEGWQEGLDGRIVRRLRKGDYAVQGHVDLHGLIRPEAKEALDRFLQASRAAGKRCVLVVHGRGLHSKDQIPVLKDAVKGWMGTNRFAKHVLAFATARPEDGGVGAIYVLLKRPGR